MLSSKPSVPHHWVLDANVLFSEWSLAFARTLALRWGARLYWTPQIEHECFRNLVRLKRLHPDDAGEQQANLVGRIGATLLTGDYSVYRADVRAVDEKDQHVAAAALALRHDLAQPVGLLTWNLKDFPRKQLLKLGVVRYGLDDLACDLLPNDGPEARRFLADCAQQFTVQLNAAPPKSHLTAFQLRTHPLPVSREDWLVFLARNRLHRLSKRISTPDA